MTHAVGQTLTGAAQLLSLYLLFTSVLSTLHIHVILNGCPHEGFKQSESIIVTPG